MSINKQEMIKFVKSLGIDPNEASILTIDNERTVYTSVSRATDEPAVLDFLDRNGIDTRGVSVVELTKDEIIVTRIQYDKHGFPIYTLGLKGIELQFESEVYDIA